MKANHYKIFLVDDHLIFRKGLRLIIESDNIGTVIAEANNGKEFMDIIEYKNPDLVIMDIDMPVMNGYEATMAALSKFPNLNILVLSMHGDQNYYNQMIVAGVKGFVLKSSDKDELEQAIITVAQGGSHFSSELLRKIIFDTNVKGETKSNKPIVELTDRELEILMLFCSGLSVGEIADKVFLSVKSIEAYRTKLLRKTGTKNTISLVLFAIKNNIVII
jgi:DNA-binding NarL/FixJ family response regulator